MALRSTWRRRAAALWAGVLAASCAIAVVVYLRYREGLVPVLVVTGVLAVVAGAVGTARIRAQEEEPMITVEDLRRR
jgi:hypothetical protein